MFFIAIDSNNFYFHRDFTISFIDTHSQVYQFAKILVKSLEKRTVNLEIPGSTPGEQILNTNVCFRVLVTNSTSFVWFRTMSIGFGCPVRIFSGKENIM